MAAALRIEEADDFFYDTKRKGSGRFLSKRNKKAISAYDKREEDTHKDLVNWRNQKCGLVSGGENRRRSNLQTDASLKLQELQELTTNYPEQTYVNGPALTFVERENSETLDNYNVLIDIGKEYTKEGVLAIIKKYIGEAYSTVASNVIDIADGIDLLENDWEKMVRAEDTSKYFWRTASKLGLFILHNKTTKNLGKIGPAVNVVTSDIVSLGGDYVGDDISNSNGSSRVKNAHIDLQRAVIDYNNFDVKDLKQAILIYQDANAGIELIEDDKLLWNSITAKEQKEKLIVQRDEAEEVLHRWHKHWCIGGDYDSFADCIIENQVQFEEQVTSRLPDALQTSKDTLEELNQQVLEFKKIIEKHEKDLGYWNEIETRSGEDLQNKMIQAEELKNNMEEKEQYEKISTEINNEIKEINTIAKKALKKNLLKKFLFGSGLKPEMLHGYTNADYILGNVEKNANKEVGYYEEMIDDKEKDIKELQGYMRYIYKASVMMIKINHNMKDRDIIKDINEMHVMQMQFDENPDFMQKNKLDKLSKELEPVIEDMYELHNLFTQYPDIEEEKKKVSELYNIFHEQKITFLSKHNSSTQSLRPNLSYIDFSNKGYATGGFINEKQLSWIGEEGPEAIIPLVSQRRSRGIDLWERTGELLGVKRDVKAPMVSRSAKTVEEIYDDEFTQELIKGGISRIEEGVTGSDGVSSKVFLLSDIKEMYSSVKREFDKAKYASPINADRYISRGVSKIQADSLILLSSYIAISELVTLLGIKLASIPTASLMGHELITIAGSKAGSTLIDSIAAVTISNVLDWTGDKLGNAYFNLKNPFGKIENAVGDVVHEIKVHDKIPELRDAVIQYEEVHDIIENMKNATYDSRSGYSITIMEDLEKQRSDAYDELLQMYYSLYGSTYGNVIPPAVVIIADIEKKLTLDLQSVIENGMVALNEAKELSDNAISTCNGNIAIWEEVNSLADELQLKYKTVEEQKELAHAESQDDPTKISRADEIFRNERIRLLEKASEVNQKLKSLGKSISSHKYLNGTVQEMAGEEINMYRELIDDEEIIKDFFQQQMERIRHAADNSATDFSIPSFGDYANNASGKPIIENANGGFINEKRLSWVGEEGPEAIIPLVPQRRSRGIELWKKAGEVLEVLGTEEKHTQGLDGDTQELLNEMLGGYIENWEETLIGDNGLSTGFTLFSGIKDIYSSIKRSYDKAKYASFINAGRYTSRGTVKGGLLALGTLAAIKLGAAGLVAKMGAQITAIPALSSYGYAMFEIAGSAAGGLLIDSLANFSLAKLFDGIGDPIADALYGQGDLIRMMENAVGDTVKAIEVYDATLNLKDTMIQYEELLNEIEDIESVVYDSRNSYDPVIMDGLKEQLVNVKTKLVQEYESLFGAPSGTVTPPAELTIDNIKKFVVDLPNVVVGDMRWLSTMKDLSNNAIPKCEDNIEIWEDVIEATNKVNNEYNMIVAQIKIAKELAMKEKPFDQRIVNEVFEMGHKKTLEKIDESLEINQILEPLGKEFSADRYFDGSVLKEANEEIQMYNDVIADEEELIEFFQQQMERIRQAADRSSTDFLIPSFGDNENNTSIQSIQKNATGGFINEMQLSWIGEEGPEAIIPLVSQRRSRGIDLWERTGELLGIKRYELPQSGDDNNTPEVSTQASVTPSFQTSGREDKEGDIQQLILPNMKEMADELGGEIAAALNKIFSNMPQKTSVS